MRRTIVLGVLAVSACGGPESPAGNQAPVAPPEVESLVQAASPSSTQDESENQLPLYGAPRRNKVLQLAVHEAGFDPAAPTPPPGLRYFTVGLRGTGLSARSDVAIEIQPFVFAQNDRGCISRPLPTATWLKRPLGEVVVFTTKQPTEGQLAFLVPDDTSQVRVLIAPAGGSGMEVSAGEEFVPAWPEPTNIIEDGSTLRVLVLPASETLATLPPPATGRENVVLDFVIENLGNAQGIEFTTSQQLRMIDPNGKFVQPSALTQRIGCRLDDGDLVPPGHVRRLLAVYDMPAGVPRKLHYRGFEVDEVTVELD